MFEKAYDLHLVIDTKTVTLSTPKGVFRSIPYPPTRPTNDPSGQDRLVLELAEVCLSADKALCEHLYKQILGD